ncbi:MAG TPA: hypothetical protein VH370_18140 [Humisphaera sp.]|jgi:hypothetical protein|nr:hypothetical protein [Humisphaera sp.]
MTPVDLLSLPAFLTFGVTAAVGVLIGLALVHRYRRETRGFPVEPPEQKR